MSRQPFGTLQKEGVAENAATASDSKSLVQIHRSVSLACLEWSVANSVHTSARIPLTIWAIAAIGLTQNHPTLARLGLK
jgi:hypothetical protein